MALAAFFAMLIAALRLLTRDDETNSGSAFLVSLPFLEFLIFQGASALIPFLLYQFWPDTWRPLISVSPWLVAVLSPLAVNQLLRLEGLELPEATGPLSRFRDRLRNHFEHELVVAEFIAMRTFIAKFAEGENLFVVRDKMLRAIPPRMRLDRADKLREALHRAETVEEAMELYLRCVGKRAFLFLFQKQKGGGTVALAPLPLFDEWEEASRRARAQGRSAASGG
jgi:hypothetical protein